MGVLVLIRCLLLACMLASTLSVPAGAAANARHRPPAATIIGHWKSPTATAALARLVRHDPVRAAMAVAARYWDAAPCGRQISVLTNRPLALGLDPTTDAWVTFDSSLGPNDLQAPAVTYTRCVISLAHWQWPSRRSMANDWNMFCLTMVHESGHLLGHPHSSVPGSVMAPVFTGESAVPAICRATRPRAGS
jgi:hypothetical protein